MFLDLTLVALIVLSLIGGWRSGALASVFAAVGVVAGLVVALAIAPFALDVTDSRVLRIAILVLLVVGFVAVGNIAGSAAGAQYVAACAGGGCAALTPFSAPRSRLWR